MPFKSKNILMFSLVITSFVAIFSFVNFYKLKKENEDLNKLLQEEKKIYKVQLEELEDSIKLSEQELHKSHINSPEVIEADSYVSAEILTNEEISVEALEIQNKKIEKEISDLKTIIDKNNKSIVDLKKNTKAGEKIVDKIKALNVNARGVKVMSDFYKNTKENKIQEIRVCFTLEANEFVKEGNKKIFVQIVNPNDQIISSHILTDTVASNQTLEYSSHVNTFYNQKDTDVCVYVDLEKKKTVKGVYKVKLFHGFDEIGATTYEYQ